MAASPRAPSPVPAHSSPDPAEPVEILPFIRDRLAALTNALRVVRLAAGNDPRVLNALDMADRQARDLAGLADGYHDHDRG